MAADRLPKLLLIGLLAAVGLAFMVAAAGAIVIWLLLSQQSPQVLGFVASFHFIALHCTSLHAMKSIALHCIAGRGAEMMQ